MKRIHGTPTPLWEKLGLQPIPPVKCNFSVGDKVIYTNEYGLKYVMVIVGFSKHAKFYGRFIHLVRDVKNESGSAWWFPHSPQEITMINQ